MATYRIFLRTENEPANEGTAAVCETDQEVRELAQRMLEDAGNKDSQAEVWTGTRFVGVVLPASAEDIARLSRFPEQWSD